MFNGASLHIEFNNAMNGVHHLEIYISNPFQVRTILLNILYQNIWKWRISPTFCNHSFIVIKPLVIISYKNEQQLQWPTATLQGSAIDFHRNLQMPVQYISMGTCRCLFISCKLPHGATLPDMEHISTWISTEATSWNVLWLHPSRSLCTLTVACSSVPCSAYLAHLTCLQCPAWPEILSWQLPTLLPPAQLSDPVSSSQYLLLCLVAVQV